MKRILPQRIKSRINILFATVCGDQIISYNELINTIIPKIIEEQGIIEHKDYSIIIENIFFSDPMHKEISEIETMLTPQMCMERDITYASNMYTTISYKTPRSNKYQKIENILLASIPVMVKSQLCNTKRFITEEKLIQIGEDVYDKGGYFIMNGVRKIVISQLRSATNKVYAYKNHAKIPKYQYYSECKGINGIKSSLAKVGILKEEITVNLPYLDKTYIVPLVILFKALGIIKNKTIIQMIDNENESIRKMLLVHFEKYDIKTQRDALIYIGNKGKKFSENNQTDVDASAIEYAKHILSTEFLIHMGMNDSQENYKEKAIYLGYMARKMLYAFLGIRKTEDRDHFANKRVIPVGIKLGQVFGVAMKNMKVEIMNMIDKNEINGRPINILSMIKTNNITNSLYSALINNSWTKGKKAQGAPSQTFEKFNYNYTLANPRKLMTPMSNEGGKIEGPRYLHNTHYGIICPYDTPEGKKCLSLDTLISTPSGEIPIGELKNGDVVYTVDISTFEVSETPITNYFTTRKKAIKLIIADGKIITSTEDHPFLVDGNWVECKNLNFQTKLYVKYSCEFLRKNIVAIEDVGIIDVADFTTMSENHSFIANGIITHNCGLITNEAMSALVSTGSNEDEIIELLKNMNIYSFKDIKKEYTEFTMIFVNWKLIGFTPTPQELLNEMRDMRRDSSIHPETSVYYSQPNKELNISTEVGRLMRPLLIVENGKVKLDHKYAKNIKQYLSGKSSPDIGNMLTDFFTKGYVELLDTAEEELSLIAMDENELEMMEPSKKIKRTHCEIHPSLMMGLGSALIPYSDHNQSPRNTYQSSMGKQAIGVPFSNFCLQTKGKTYVLNYPQKPLVSTELSRIVGYDNLPCGQNAIVAICPWKGFGQEDSIIMNQDSIDRGFMHITVYTGYEAKIKKDKNEYLGIPSINCSDFRGNPGKLNMKTFIVSEGTEVEDGDILIGKLVKENNQLVDNSVIYDHAWPGKVYSVRKGICGNGYEYIRVVIAQLRPPICGDKFSSRYGQKGTVGKTYRSYDLFYTKEGIAPDIIVNPLAFPSRMTIGMLIEMIQGRKICSSYLDNLTIGKVFRLDDENWDNPDDFYLSKNKFKKHSYSPSKQDGDSTPFSKNFSLSSITDELKSLGINEYCDEEVINGQTGQPLECLIYTGVCYYQRLRHMVIDKVHARSKGSRTRMTRQPKEGRKAGGGFKIGHMERDVIFSYGSQYFAKDRLMEQSDETRVWFCRICGLQAIVRVRENGHMEKEKCTYKIVQDTRKCNACQCGRIYIFAKIH